MFGLVVLSVDDRHQVVEFPAHLLPRDVYVGCVIELNVSIKPEHQVERLNKLNQVFDQIELEASSEMKVPSRSKLRRKKGKRSRRSSTRRTRRTSSSAAGGSSRAANNTPTASGTKNDTQRGGVPAGSPVAASTTDHSESVSVSASTPVRGKSYQDAFAAHGGVT